MERINRNTYYPIADEVGSAEFRRDHRAMWTGEKRAPRKGEFFLSGSIIEAYDAKNDLTTEYHIARLIRGEVRWVPIEPVD